MLESSDIHSALFENRVDQGFVHGILWPTLIGLFLSTVVFACIYSEKASVESFLTFRGTTSWFRVGISHFATLVGGWAIFIPPMYGHRFGWLSLFFYPAIFGLVYLLVAISAPRMLAQMERAKVGRTFYSLTDYVTFRFGAGISLLVGANTVFYSLVIMFTELANVGNFVRLAVNGGIPGSAVDKEGVSYFTLFPIIGIAVTTAAYTIIAGFPASIWSDLVQGVGVVTIVTVLLISVLIVNTQGTDLFKYSGVELYQVLYFANMLFLITPSAAMNLGIWQRVLVTTKRSQQRKALVVGALLYTPVFFLFSLAGFTLGAKYNLPLDQRTHFTFEAYQAFPVSVLIGLPKWMFGFLFSVVILLASSTVDSMQSGVVSVFAGRLLNNSTGKVLMARANKGGFSHNFPSTSSAAIEQENHSPFVVHRYSLFIAGGIVLIITSIAAGLAGYMTIDNRGPLSTAIVGIYGICNLIQMAIAVPLFMGLSPSITTSGALAGMLSGIAFPFLWGIYHDGSFSGAIGAYFLRSIHFDPVMSRVTTCFFNHFENMCAFERNPLNSHLITSLSQVPLSVFLPTSCRDPYYPQFIVQHSSTFKDANVSDCFPTSDATSWMIGNPVSWTKPDVAVDIWNLQLFIGILLTSFVVTWLFSSLNPSDRLSFY